MGKPKERDLLEDGGVDGMRMVVRETGWEDVEWVQLAHDRDRWRAVVNAVMNLQVWRHGVSYLLN
jgi:hypothetical protein